MPDPVVQKNAGEKSQDSLSLAVEELLQNRISLEQFEDKLADIAPNTVQVAQPESDYLEISMVHTTSGYPYFYGFNLPVG